MKWLAIAAVLTAAALIVACEGNPTPPAATATPPEFTMEDDCSSRMLKDAEKIYGQDADLNAETDRFNKFYKNVILVGLQYGRDETASMGAGFEALYQSLLGESAYVSERRREAWEYAQEVFARCSEAQGVAPYQEPEIDATTRCVAEAVAEAWKQYGDGAFDYAKELTFTFDELAKKGTELSVGEAWSIAQDYRRATGRSAFENPAAFELATGRTCPPWQGKGTGMPIAGP